MGSDAQTAPQATSQTTAATTTLAVSVAGGDDYAADALWSTLEEQIGKKGKFSLVRVESNLSDVAIHLLRQQELTDLASGPLPSFIDDPARLKIAVEVQSEDIGRAENGGFEEQLKSIAGPGSLTAVPLPDREKLKRKSTEGAADVQVVLHMQAKAIAKLLKGFAIKPKALPSGEAKSAAPKKKSRGEARERPKDSRSKKRAKEVGPSEPGGSERKASRREKKKDNRVTVAVIGLEPALADDLQEAIGKEFARAGAETAAASGRSKADLIVVVPPAGVAVEDLISQISEIPNQRHTAIAFVETYRAVADEGSSGDDRTISNAARSCGGVVLDLDAKFRQLGYTRMLRPSGDLNPARLEKIATALRNIAAAKGLGGGIAPCLSPERSADFLDAASKADGPAALLEALSWDEKALPRSLRSKFDVEKIEAFAAAKLILPRLRKPKSEGEPVDDAPAELVLGNHIDWSMDLPDGKARETLLGLDFLSPVLTYWFMRANSSKADDVKEVDHRLKECGITASFMLNRAGEIISSFQQRRSEPPAAWEESVAWSRARTLLLYLLCAKTAAKRRINFDPSHCAAAFQTLLETFEWLRHRDYRHIGSLDAIEQDVLLIAAGLPLRSLPYGEHLIEQTLADMIRNQIDKGLAEDGVWQGSFNDHCSVLSSLATTLHMLQDNRLSGGDPLAEAIRKMGPFAAAILMPDGRPIAIDEASSKPQARMLGLARAALQSGKAEKKAKAPATQPAGKDRPGETLVYPKSGYFISHSGKVAGRKSSQLVLRASTGSITEKKLGGISLAFAAGSTPLVVGGGAATRKASEAVREASQHDLAAHNSIRVDGASYDVAQSARPGAISLLGHWAGDDWAAARTINTAYGNAVAIRTAIHLKTLCALVVVDEVRSTQGNQSEFGQFWHLGPQFTSHSASGQVLHFASDVPGVLNVATDPETDSALAIERGGPANPIGWTAGASGDVVPNFYLRRTKLSAHAAMATIFHFTPAPQPVSIEIGAESIGTWGIHAKGAGFDARFTLKGDEVLRS